MDNLIRRAEEVSARHDKQEIWDFVSKLNDDEVKSLNKEFHIHTKSETDYKRALYLYLIA
jgi:hypothetical protein